MILFRTLLLLATVSAFFTANAQSKYYTRDGRVSFFSSTPMEDIEALSNDASSVFDIKTGKVEFGVPMKSFTFEKALMQEHFNEDYVESDKFPKAKFKGIFEFEGDFDPAKAGEYKVIAKGKFTLHGITQEITEKGTFTVSDEGNLFAVCVFHVKPADYDIEIPSTVRDKIAKTVEVTIKMNYKPLKR